MNIRRLRMMNAFLISLVATFLATSFAYADERTTDRPAQNPALHRVSFTTDLGLLIPTGKRFMGTLATEVRLGRKWGVVVTNGLGTRAQDTNAENGVLTWELGGGARVYPFGNFDLGAHLGTGLLYSTTAHGTAEFLYSAPALGVSWEALAGYKWVSKVGFTLDGSFALRYLVADNHQTASGSPPVSFGATLGIGWSS